MKKQPAKRDQTLWVIEMRSQHGSVWKPTCGAYLSRPAAKLNMTADWMTANPDDDFRVKPYRRVEGS